LHYLKNKAKFKKFVDYKNPETALSVVIFWDDKQNGEKR